MNRSRILAIANILGLILVMVVNSLSVSLPINGLSTVELSDSYPNLFVPAGQTFSIWGLIYLAVIVFCLSELIKTFKANQSRNPVDKVGWLFLVTCAANIAWIFSWHYLMVELSLVCMAILLVALIFIYQALSPSDRTSDNWTARFAFSIYLGWISIAIIANVTALLVHYGWEGFGLSPETWVIVMIAIGLALGLVYLVKNNDPFHPLVIAWAFYGIYLKRSSALVEPVESIITVSVIACSVLIIAVLIQFGRKRSVYS